MSVDLKELKQLAEAASGQGWYASLDVGSALDVVTKDDADYVIAANPATILKLLAELEQLRAMEVGIGTLEKLRHAMMRYGISSGEGGMESFSVRFESHLLTFIQSALEMLPRVQTLHAELEKVKAEASAVKVVAFDEVLAELATYELDLLSMEEIVSIVNHKKVKATLNRGGQ